MSSGYKIEAQWPGVAWHGSSEVHRSFFRNFGISGLSIKDHKAIMTALMYSGYGGKVFDLLFEILPGVSWLLSQEQFETLVTSECWRMLKGMGQQDTPHKLVNKITGNTFHRIGLLGDFVIGIRFWMDGDAGFGSSVTPGFRVRIEKMDESEEVARERLESEVEQAEGLVQEMVEILEIAAPTEDDRRRSEDLLTGFE